MRMFIVALILFSAQLLLAAPTANDCRRFFNYPDRTNDFISYIESISDLPSMKPQLIGFYQNLSHGSLNNPILPSAARVNAELKIHQAGLSTIIENSSFDLAKLKIWAGEQLTRLKSESLERTQVKETTNSGSRLMRFVEVHDPKQSNDPTAPAYGLIMMDGPVTQSQWVEIFGNNPSWSAHTEPDAITMNLRGHTIYILPDHPVELMTFWSAVIFANEMSKRMNLPEAYDLTGVTFETAKDYSGILAEAGTGKLNTGDVISQNAFAKNNAAEKVIARPGLRLPTADELEYLLHKKARFDGLPLADLTDQQASKLIDANAATTHAVGTTLGAVINGHVVFDLTTNVSFWTTHPSMDIGVGAIGSGSIAWGNDYAVVSTNIPQVRKSHSMPRNCSDKDGRMGLILIRTVQP